MRGGWYFFKGTYEGEEKYVGEWVMQVVFYVPVMVQRELDLKINVKKSYIFKGA
jgi:hypothetical protein